MRLIRPTVVLLSTAIATTAAPGQTADREALVRGNTQFALDLYAKLCAETQGNVFFAPQCISTALAMTYAGARTETAEQMAETLHFDLGQDRQHAAFAELAKALSLGGDETTLTIANRLWGQEGEPLLPSYLDTISAHYACRKHASEDQRMDGPADGRPDQGAVPQGRDRPGHGARARQRRPLQRDLVDSVRPRPHAQGRFPRPRAPGPRC
jgi:hypothetical protein